MRAALVYGAGDVRVEDRPDPKIHEPTDAVVRLLRRRSAAATCGRVPPCPPPIKAAP